MRIWTDDKEKQRVYIDVGEGNEVVEFMRKNSIFVERWNGDVATFNTAQFSLQRSANNLFLLTDFYQKNGWEVDKESQTIVDELLAKAEEERLRREDEKLKKWAEEQEKKKKQQTPIYRVKVSKKGTWYFGF